MSVFILVLVIKFNIVAGIGVFGLFRRGIDSIKKIFVVFVLCTGCYVLL